ncbi:hypothetical protein ACP275_07G105200 [Erythranthe tilingii]
MAALFPSYLGTLSEGFSKETKKYESQKAVETYTDKLLNRLSVLLFHIDKQIDKVLLQGQFLPKKLNIWPLEARALKCQVSDLIQKQRNRKGDLQIREELVAVGIEMINQLKRCPFKDEYMYDKPIPEIVRKHEKQDPKRKAHQYTSGTESDSQQSVKLASYEEYSISQSGGRRCNREGCSRTEIGRSGLCIRHGGGRICKMVGCSKSVEANSDFCISHGGGRICQYPECTKGAYGSTVFCKAHGGGKRCTSRGCTKPVHMGTLFCVSHATPITYSESITEDQNAVQSTAVSIEDGGSMPIPTSDSDSRTPVESASHGEIQVVPDTDEMSKLMPEKEHYLVSMKDNIIKLELDHQTFLVADCPSSLSRQSVLNLVEQDLCLLPETSEYTSCYLCFLQKNDRLTHIHDSFFQTMPDLVFLDMSDTRIRILPSSLFGLSKLKVLLLRNCLSLDNLPPEIRELVNLEVLDLSGSELYDLPDEIDELTLLRHMQLSFYGPDDESEYAHLPPRLVSPGFLSDIEKLETLTISVHPDDHRWAKIAEPISKDIGVLENLSYLQFYFPQVQMFEDFIERSSSWCKGTLVKFKFIVGRDVKRIASRVPNEIELTFHEERQSLRFVNGNEKVPQVIQNVLARATSFYLDHHMKVKSLSEFGISVFKFLKFCLLRECPKIQSIIGNNSTEGAFPCLEHLSIYYLWELEYICKSPSVKGSFPALTHLTVSTCRKLKFVLWESMLPSLSNLKELVVEECESVEKIVRQEKEKVNTNNNAEMLPELRKLVLQNLPELVTLGNGLCLSEDKLDINGCPKFVLNSRPKEQSVVKQRKFLRSLKAALQFK